MQSTAGTKQDYENLNQLNLIACLVLYQHRQDISTGINWLSNQTKSLLNYYKMLQQKDLVRLYSAAYYRGIIEKGVTEIKMLNTRAKKAKNKGKLLERALAINATMIAAKEKLDELEAG